MCSGTSGSHSPQYTCRCADRSSLRIYSALHGEKIVPLIYNETRMYSSSMHTVHCSGRLSCHAPPLAMHNPLCHALPLAMHAPCRAHTLPCMPLLSCMPPTPATHALLPCLPAKCSICLYSRFYDTHLPQQILFSASISLHHQVAPLCLPGSFGSSLYPGQTGDI